MVDSTIVRRRCVSGSAHQEPKIRERAGMRWNHRQGIMAAVKALARRLPGGITCALQAGWLFSAVAMAGAAMTRAAENRTNAPASFKPDFDPNLPVLVLTARGSIDKAQKTPCSLSLSGPGAP